MKGWQIPAKDEWEVIGAALSHPPPERSHALCKIITR